ncbi:chloride channel protein, partial [Duncaniella muris]
MTFHQFRHSSGWKFNRRLLRFLLWRRRHVSDTAFLFIVATVTGLLAGAGAFVLKRLVAGVSGLLVAGLHSMSANWVLLIIPLAGILLTGVFCRYVIRMKLAHGVRQLMKNLSEKIYRLRAALTVTPILASTITLGFGGSAGSEGPIAYAGAAIGSNLGRVMRFSPRMMMVIVGCGAGAGIAGIFKSPLGGVLFTLEVLRLPLSTVSVLVLLVSCITAGMTAYVLSGCTLDIPFAQGAGFDSSLLPYV